MNEDEMSIQELGFMKGVSFSLYKNFFFNSSFITKPQKILNENCDLKKNL